MSNLMDSIDWSDISEDLVVDNTNNNYNGNESDANKSYQKPTSVKTHEFGDTEPVVQEKGELNSTDWSDISDQLFMSDKESDAKRDDQTIQTVITVQTHEFEDSQQLLIHSKSNMELKKRIKWQSTVDHQSMTEKEEDIASDKERQQQCRQTIPSKYWNSNEEKREINANQLILDPIVVDKQHYNLSTNGIGNKPATTGMSVIWLLLTTGHTVYILTLMYIALIGLLVNCGYRVLREMRKPKQRDVSHQHIPQIRIIGAPVKQMVIDVVNELLL